MAQSLNKPPNGDPSATEIFRLFRSTTTASLEGLRLLMEECADLRAELVIIHELSSDGDDHGVFSARQKDRILELQAAANAMEALAATLPQAAAGAADGGGES